MVTIVTFLTKVYFGFTSLPTSVTVNILTPPTVNHFFTSYLAFTRNSLEACQESQSTLALFINLYKLLWVVHYTFYTAVTGRPSGSST